MNKDDIKKALKFCADSNDCDDCPYDVVRSCSDRLKLDARELIAEQEKEIERLKDEDTRLTEKLKQVLLAVDTVKEMTAMCNIDKQNAEIERLKAQQREIERLKAENETYCKQINQAYDTGYDDGYESCQDDIKKADELLKEYE